MSADDAAGTTRWRIEVDREACIGGGVCVGTASNHFTLEGGRSRAIAEEVPPDDTALEAAWCCPVEAIIVRDLATGKQLAPEE
jgi:ferredoxin